MRKFEGNPRSCNWLSNSPKIKSNLSEGQVVLVARWSFLGLQEKSRHVIQGNPSFLLFVGFSLGLIGH